MNSKQASVIGLSAIILWSLIVALIKQVTQHFGVIGGAALMYSLASVFLLFSFGWTSLKTFPKKYLIGGSLLFVSYELCLSLSIGYSQSPLQAIEIGMLNYLWPTMVVIFSIIFNQQKVNAWIIPGVILALVGMYLVLMGNAGFDLGQLLLNLASNPLGYALALLGVFLWAGYCALTRRSAEGKNGVTFFFVLVSTILWIKWLFSAEVSIDFTLNSTFYLVLAAFAMGIGYGAWNIGMMYGNVTLLATASYFIPIFSAVASSLILTTELGLNFWQGTVMVCIGSLLCWRATKT